MRDAAADHILAAPASEAEQPLLSAFPEVLPASMDFAGLLNEGICYAQQMSSSDWTDYNEHDPGLTILEQLCYALTDLGMRGRYPMNDLLAGPGGRIARDTLFSGNRVLTTAPQTADDYRRLLYARVDGLKNFWLLPVKHGLQGLYHGFIEVYGHANRARVLAEAARLLRANRLLGEDLAGLCVLEQQRIRLAGVVEVENGCDPDEVMGAILFTLNVYAVPGPAAAPRHARAASGAPYDALYEGPLLRDSVIEEIGETALPRRIGLDRIVRLVRGCAGVRSLTAPCFADAGGIEVPLRAGALPYFEVPAVDGRWPFTMRDARGGAIKLDRGRVERFMARDYAALKAAEQAGRRSPEMLAYRRLPTGRQLGIGHYHSIQHQFPATYGLGLHGVPSNPDWRDSAWIAGATAGPERLAQARQLCAYLLLFEQMLANGFSQLAAARHLFSLRPPHARSYVGQPLVGESARPRDPPLAPSVLPEPPPPPAPAPRPERGGYRYLVEVFAHRRGDWGGRGFHADRVAALYSARFADRDEAGLVRRLIGERAQDAGNYAVTYLDGGSCALALMAADGTTLAHGRQRYAGWEQASAAAVALALRLREAHERGMLWRHLRLRRQPAAGMRVFRHGHDVLSAFWDIPLSERDWRADHVLGLGRDPGNYRLLRYGDGWRCDLYEHRQRVAEGHLYGATPEDAWRHCMEVVELLRRIGEDGTAFLRHVELLPDDAGTPSVPAPEWNAQRYYRERMEEIVARYDDYPARRNAFLDHLLARFDEAFDDRLLQSADPRPANRQDFLLELAGWKSSFLAAYPHASARRACGRDYGRRLAREMPFGAGLEHRLYSLLGMGGAHQFVRYPSSRGRLARQRPWYDGADTAGEGRLAFEFWDLRQDLTAMLLEYGTDLGRYEIRLPASGAEWRLYFVHPNGKRRRVMAHPERHELERARDRLVVALARGGSLWQQVYADEGLYVVEHILLRPMGAAPSAEAFYDGRISVLFPAWPLRFRDGRLRDLAESLVAQHVPAHLAWKCHWLEFHEMRAFEDLYACWSAARLEATRLGRRAHAHLNGHAQALRSFLEHLPKEDA